MDTRDIQDRLAEFFPSEEVNFLPITFGKNNQGQTTALSAPFVNARQVQRRLDEVVGADGWQTQYEILSNGSVVCKLSVLFGDRWVSKEDVGSPSEQPDDGDRIKAAFSDAFKRAAVCFGIGRYLNDVKNLWLPYDSQRKRYEGTPRMPDRYLPRATGRPATNGQTAKAPPAGNLADRVRNFELELIKKNLAEPGEVAAWAQCTGESLSWRGFLPQWDGEGRSERIKSACREFETLRKSGMPLLPRETDADGVRLNNWLAYMDQWASSQGFLEAGAIRQAIANEAAAGGLPEAFVQWKGAPIKTAVVITLEMIHKARAAAALNG